MGKFLLAFNSFAYWLLGFRPAFCPAKAFGGDFGQVATSKDLRGTIITQGNYQAPTMAFLRLPIITVNPGQLGIRIQSAIYGSAQIPVTFYGSLQSDGQTSPHSTKSAGFFAQRS